MDKSPQSSAQSGAGQANPVASHNLEGLRSKAEIVKLADYEDEELTRSIIRDLLDL
jgi:hypothetical protein